MKEIDHTKQKSRADKLKSLFAIKHPIYRTWWIYPIAIILVLILVVFVPLAINECYKADKGYITVWGASDVLSFYAVVLSGIISISALIVTINHNKKETDRQLRFYMGQAKAPFFIVDRISQIGSSKKFLKNENRQWIKEYGVPKPGEIEAEEKGCIEIIVKNIGDGLALEPSYQVEMFASTVVLDHVVEKGKLIILKYDFWRNLTDQYVYYHFKDGFAKFNEGWATHYTRINLYYKNMLGIEFKQQIVLELRFDFVHKKITIQINELSPQIS